jgi:hypothetical protein
MQQPQHPSSTPAKIRNLSSSGPVRLDARLLALSAAGPNGGWSTTRGPNGGW